MKGKGKSKNMKSIYDFFIFRAIIIAFCVLGTVPVYAQSLVEECESLYIKFLSNRKGPDIEKYEKAVVLGNEYLGKCGDLKDQETVKDYVTKQIPKIEKTIKEILDPFPDVNQFKNKKDYAFAIGKRIVRENSDGDIDISLILASIGFDNATANPPNDEYNEDAITFAKIALQSLNKNISSGTGNYGAFGYIYKTKECPDGKLNATGWMNYIIGYIMFVRQKQIYESLPYLYQATQIGCETKNIAEIYRLIGNYYVEEFKKLNNSHSENKALQGGYANRMLDAYARAYNATPQSQELLKTVALSRVRAIYNNDKKGLNEYLKSVADTPFIDPTTPVSPLPKNEQ